MKKIIIVAMGANREIGKDNNLLWHLPIDMGFFKDSTLGHTIITGRKNFESIPHKYRPLKNRQNIILTHQKNYSAPGAVVTNTIEEALSKSESEHTYIIGGGEIYGSFLDANLVDEMLITHVDGKFDADTFFPEFDENDWHKELISHHVKDDRHDYNFKMLRYSKK